MAERLKDTTRHCYTHGWERVQFSPWLTRLREEIRKDTVQKIEDAKKEG